MTLKNLDPMILSVCDENPAGRVDRDALESLELSVGLAPAPEAAQEGAVRVEDLDPVVAGVRHKYVPLLINSYTSASGKMIFSDIKDIS